MVHFSRGRRRSVYPICQVAQQYKMIDSREGFWTKLSSLWKKLQGTGAKRDSHLRLFRTRTQSSPKFNDNNEQVLHRLLFTFQDGWLNYHVC